MNLILKTLRLIRTLHELKEDGLKPKSEVKLMPKTLEQLDDAIKEVQSQCMVSVVSLHEGGVTEIVEHRLVSAKESPDVLAELCRKYEPLIGDDDIEIVKDEGYLSSGGYHICAIHLDSQGRYDQSPGEE